jgi:opacity protein-like surface antigen
MRTIIVAAVAAVAAFSLACFAPAPAALAANGIGAHRLGVGANYWKTIDEIDVADVEEDGFSWLASYQYAPVGLFKFEVDLEYFPDLGGGTETVWAPEAFVIVGGTIYAGAGVGIYYSDGDWADEPFYMLRAGFDMPILPFLFLDVNANYRFNDWDTFSTHDLDTDTIRLGAAVRFAM